MNTSDQETKNLLEHAKDVFIGEISTVINSLAVRNPYAIIDTEEVHLDLGREANLDLMHLADRT